MKKEYKNIIGIDWQSWPIYKLNLKDILIELGANVINGRIGFDENDPILNVFPRRLIDTGMGYCGTTPEYIVCIDKFKDDEEEIINIWTEPRHLQGEIDKFIENAEYFNNKILANKN